MVLAPGRGVAYQLLAAAEPSLGERLHNGGWGPHRMVPFGYAAPVFPGAKRQRGRYVAGGRGMIEFGSPVPEIVEAWARAISKRELIDWGGVAMRITNVAAVEPPDFSLGRARMRTATPVVMKRTVAGATQGLWLLPTEPEFPTYFQGNLNRKLETLGISGRVAVEKFTWVGPKRSFAVGNGAKPGAPIEAELSGDPEALQAIWSWGLGQANSAGFGWVLA